MIEKENLIKKKSVQFALDILVFGDRLNAQHKFVVANQIIKSGTAVGALIREAQFAESKLDFIHKLRIALKEANETLYWLELCEQTNGYPFSEELKLNAEELVKILIAIINSTSKNMSQYENKN